MPKMWGKIVSAWQHYVHSIDFCNNMSYVELLMVSVLWKCGYHWRLRETTCAKLVGAHHSQEIKWEWMSWNHDSLQITNGQYLLLAGHRRVNGTIRNIWGAIHLWVQSMSLTIWLCVFCHWNYCLHIKTSSFHSQTIWKTSRESHNISIEAIQRWLYTWTCMVQVHSYVAHCPLFASNFCKFCQLIGDLGNPC